MEHPRWFINAADLRVKLPVNPEFDPASGPQYELINPRTTELYDTQMIMAEILFARKFQHSFAIIVLPFYILG